MLICTRTRVVDKMAGMMSSLIEYISAQDAMTLLWQAAIAAACLAAAFLFAVHSNRSREKAMRDKAWRSHSDLRSRGA